MTHFQVKLIALITMFIDHTALVFGYYGLNYFSKSTTYLLRSIGRIAFPLFAFNIANGMEKTRSKEKYLQRLVIFAFLSQLPYMLMHYAGNTIMLNYKSMLDLVKSLKFSFTSSPILFFCIIAANIMAIYFFQKKIGKSFCIFYLLASLNSIISITSLPYMVHLMDPSKLNVFYTLFTGAFLIYVLDLIKERFKKLNFVKFMEVVLLVLLAGLTVFIFTSSSDYGYKGVALIFVLYLFKNIKALQLISLTIWLVFTYYFPIPLDGKVSLMFLFSLISVLIVGLYTGNKGYNNKFFRLITYIFYPLHMIILFILARIYMLSNMI